MRTQTPVTGTCPANSTSDAGSGSPHDTGRQEHATGGGVMTGRRGSRAARWATVTLLAGTVAALSPGVSVGVLEASSYRGSLDDMAVHALRIVDADGSVSYAGVKDADGVTSA